MLRTPRRQFSKGLLGAYLAISTDVLCSRLSSQGFLCREQLRQIGQRADLLLSSKTSLSRVKFGQVCLQSIIKEFPKLGIPGCNANPLYISTIGPAHSTAPLKDPGSKINSHNRNFILFAVLGVIKVLVSETKASTSICETVAG